MARCREGWIDDTWGPVDHQGAACFHLIDLRTRRSPDSHNSRACLAIYLGWVDGLLIRCRTLGSFDRSQSVERASETQRLHRQSR